MTYREQWVLTYERIPCFVALRDLLEQNFKPVKDVLNGPAYSLDNDISQQTQIMLRYKPDGKLAVIYFPKSRYISKIDELDTYFSLLKRSFYRVDELIYCYNKSRIILDEIHLEITAKQTN